LTRTQYNEDAGLKYPRAAKTPHLDGDRF